jgi:hypothetical protein
MAIDFPNSPTTGDIHTVSGKQWQWDSEKWTAYGVSLNPGVLKVDSGNSRVGINQTTPTVALDVTGSARITGDLTVSGTTVTVDAASILAKDSIVLRVPLPMLMRPPFWLLTQPQIAHSPCPTAQERLL